VSLIAAFAGLLTEWKKALPTVSPPAVTDPGTPFVGVPMTITNPSSFLVDHAARVDCTASALFDINGTRAVDRFRSLSGKAPDLEPGETIAIPCTGGSIAVTDDGSRFAVKALTYEVVVHFETAVGPFRVARQTRPAVLHWVADAYGAHHWGVGAMKY
jgi:hypothetical protein